MAYDSTPPNLLFPHKNKEKQALVAWFTSSRMPVFGSLLFNNRAHSNPDRRLALLHLYWNKMDRVFFGNAVERMGWRIQRHVAIHYGANEDNVHAHFISETLGDQKLFCKVARKVWSDLSSETADLESTRIEAAHDTAACASYLLHERWGENSYCPLLSHFDPNRTSNIDLNQSAKLRVRKALYGNL